LPGSNQALQAFNINTRRTIRVDTIAAQTDAFLQQMQDQIAALQIDLAASAAAMLAATNAAAAATTALARAASNRRAKPGNYWGTNLCSLTGHGKRWSIPELGHLYWGQTVQNRC
jgi:hypothetical protein